MIIASLVFTLSKESSSYSLGSDASIVREEKVEKTPAFLKKHPSLPFSHPAEQGKSFDMPPPFPAGLPFLSKGGRRKPFSAISPPPLSTEPFDEKKPLIAIIIDDLGFDRERVRQISQLPCSLTLSFFPHVPDIRSLVEEVKQRHHEALLHVPMEPINPAIDPGPNALKTYLSSQEIQQRSARMFENASLFVGANNHMGSKVTQDKRLMEIFLKELKKHNMFFLDSKTTFASIASKMAKKLNIPTVSRDIFLDVHLSREAIEKQFKLLEKIALKKGYAIAIGHPHKITIDALKRWLHNGACERVTIVPLSQLMHRQDIK